MEDEPHTAQEHTMDFDEALPSLENLRCFLAAARHLHFRRGAEEVHLTPAAFGQRIRQLEEQVGSLLFERSTRSVRLTPEGHLLVPRAQRALREALRCVQEVRAHHGSPMPIRLMLGTRFELGLSWVVPSLMALPDTLSFLDIHLYFGNGPDILERLHAGLVDTIITSAPTTRSDWTSAFLHREDYVFVASPELLARQPFTHIEDAASHTLLDVNSSLPLARYLQAVVPRPMEFAHVRECGAGGAILTMAEASAGVAVLPLYMAQHALEQGTLVRLLPSLELLADSFRLLSRQDALFPDAIASLAAHLRTCPLR